MSLFFDYELPGHLIAQHPAARRDESRLMVLDCAAGSISQRHFRELPDFLRPGDLLVLNDSKVLPARLVGRRERTGGKWEGLFLREYSDGAWELLAQTRGFVQVGETCVTDSGLRLKLLARTEDRHWLMVPDPPGLAVDLLRIHGHIPLPPYIRKGEDEPADRERYQTVFAQAVGSVAAPTAGLHFTPELLVELERQGVGVARVTLHVGLGTFAPVKADDPTQHKIHAEWAEVSERTAELVNATKAAGGRVLAVGTTSARTLETCAKDGTAKPFRGETDLFIHPSYQFRAVDALLTNFHLPRTTLLLLVQALAGSELLKRAYAEAVANEYRFFSYGDAMLVGSDWNPSPRPSRPGLPGRLGIPAGERGRGEGDSGSVTGGKDMGLDSEESPSPLTPLPEGRGGQSTLDPNSFRRWVHAAFADVWRTSVGRPGYAVFAPVGWQPTSKELRRAMMDIVTAFVELSPRQFVVERAGRFDQQVSTRFHRDGAADMSLLLLGYEPTTVESKLFVLDPFRAAGSGGSAFHYLKTHKPMTKEGDDELTRHAVNVLGSPGQARIVVLNNCTVLENPPPGHPLGVLHRGLIEHPDPAARRVINSMGLMYEGEPHRESVSAERLDWFLNGDTTD